MFSRALQVRVPSTSIHRFVCVPKLLKQFPVAIIAAYYFGSSLYPETKTFRFLADVVNDASIVLDTLTPYIGAMNLSETLPFIPTGSTLQIIALCLSGALRSLCGLVAGGSKAALTNHFASPLSGKGDVGELNAKDASRETVIGLTGMLVRSGVLFVVSCLMTYTKARHSSYTIRQHADFHIHVALHSRWRAPFV